MDESLENSIRQEISKAKKILLVCHMRPDGDAIGSLIGLGLALEAAGKTTRLVSVDGAPSSFKFLSGYEKIVQTIDENYDLMIAIDCSDLHRTGFDAKIQGRVDINIDHHITNDNFARFNWALNKEIAMALLTGIITDTIGFRTSNVTPRTLRIAADLMSMGVNISEIYMRALVNRSIEAVRYWGAGLNKIHQEDSMVWTSLTIEDQKKTRYSGRDDADLINILASIEGISICMIFIEQPGGGVKVSWRAQPGFDVSQIAMQFGGGGHPAAAGAMYEGGLKEVQDIVIRKTQKLLTTDGNS
jgi:phosphoesterase RecJ-like protein